MLIISLRVIDPFELRSVTCEQTVNTAEVKQRQPYFGDVLDHAFGKPTFGQALDETRNAVSRAGFFRGWQRRETTILPRCDPSWRT